MLTAERGQTEYGICSTTFLELAFRTDSYRIEVEFHDDGSWSYVQDTMLMVRGRDTLFEHRDRPHRLEVGQPREVRLEAERELLGHPGRW